MSKKDLEFDENGRLVFIDRQNEEAPEALEAPAEDAVPAEDASPTADPAAAAATEAEAPEETEAEALEETEEAAPEETEEESPAVDAEEPAPLCRRCTEQPAQEDSPYCADCAAEMKKIRIPLFGWLGGLLVLVAALAALASAFLNSAPALQVARAEASADKGNWMLAYKQYRKADDVVYQVDQILKDDGEPNPFVMIGTAARAKQALAALRGYTPVDAHTFVTTYLTDPAAQKRYPVVAEIQEEYDIYEAAYAPIEEPVMALVNGEADAASVNAQLEALRGQISDVYLDYFLAAITAYYDCPTEEILARYQKLHQTAKASGREYSWMYYDRYTSLLQNTGDYEGARALAEEMLQKDPSNITMLNKKIKLSLQLDDTAQAEAAYGQLSTLYGDTDAQAIAAELLMLRFRGEFDKAETLVTDAIESADVDTAVELHRQMALIYLLQENYDKAFDEAYEANYNAYYVYQYYGDDSLFSDELDNTLYLSAYLCQLHGDGSAEYTGKIAEVLASYDGARKELSAQTRAVLDGEKTVRQVLTEGAYDLA